ncbi:MAG TPA: YceI family protein [Pyrinomonadaceae bacterium]|nr:YceI family protein [Pyrinomonadaceae bacterium]
MRYATVFLLAAACVVSAACSNPAADVAKATTNAAASPGAAPRERAGERIPVTPEGSQIAFTGSKVTGSESGRFEKFSGAIHLVGESPEQSRVEVEIETASVATDSEGLAEHLKAEDFFDVAGHPKATFTSTGIRAGGERGATHTVTGDLELRGVRKSITFPASISVARDAVTVRAEFAINRKDFGITYAGRADDLIRDEVVLRLSLRAPRSS